MRLAVGGFTDHELRLPVQTRQVRRPWPLDTEKVVA